MPQGYVFTLYKTLIKYNSEKKKNHLALKACKRVAQNFPEKDLCHLMDAQKNVQCHLSSGKYKLESKECTEKILE